MPEDAKVWQSRLEAWSAGNTARMLVFCENWCLSPDASTELARSQIRDLVAALMLLLEDMPRLRKRDQRLGLGFEDLIERRLRQRLALLAVGSSLPAHLCMVDISLWLRDPEAVSRFLATKLGRILNAEETRWLEDERQVQLLNYCRQPRSGHQGRYCRLVDGRPVLHQVGVAGRWVVIAPTSVKDGLARAAAEEERRGIQSTYGVLPAPSSNVQPRMSSSMPTLSCTAVLRCGQHGKVSLYVGDSVIAEASPADDPIKCGDFLEKLSRVSEWRLPSDQMGDRTDSVVLWSRAVLIRAARRPQLHPELPLAGWRIRLLHVRPASSVIDEDPVLGRQYLAEALERYGAVVDLISLVPSDLSTRLPELLGADVLGFSVYVHNVVETADTVALVRQEGYEGRIILGGPQTAHIDEVARQIDGWDAIVRGEAEDILPRLLMCWPKGAEDIPKDLEMAHGLLLQGQGWLWVWATAHPNRARLGTPPLPFDPLANAGTVAIRLFNLNRGCPYACSFCANHQGSTLSRIPTDSLLQWGRLILVERWPIPENAARHLASILAAALGVTVPPQLPLVLLLLRRNELPPLVPGLAEALDALEFPPSPYYARHRWLAAKAALIETHNWPIVESPLVEAVTCEDNTLVARSTVLAFLEWRRTNGFENLLQFSPGQNSVSTLLDESFLGSLATSGKLRLALGVDGTSNVMIRENGKPRYKIQDVVEINAYLEKMGAEVANNYILIAPTATFLDVVEAILLFIILPINWRRHVNDKVNLQVIKEEGTLETDEGIIHSPHEAGWNVPIRDPAVRALISRHRLSSEMTWDELRARLWNMIETDENVIQALPLVHRRWQADLDSDRETAMLARLLGNVPLSPSGIRDICEKIVYAQRRLGKTSFSLAELHLHL